MHDAYQLAGKKRIGSAKGHLLVGHFNVSLRVGLSSNSAQSRRRTPLMKLASSLSSSSAVFGAPRSDRLPPRPPRPLADDPLPLDDDLGSSYVRETPPRLLPKLLPNPRAGASNKSLPSLAWCRRCLGQGLTCRPPNVQEVREAQSAGCRSNRTRP